MSSCSSSSSSSLLVCCSSSSSSPLLVIRRFLLFLARLVRRVDRFDRTKQTIPATTPADVLMRSLPSDKVLVDVLRSMLEGSYIRRDLLELDNLVLEGDLAPHLVLTRLWSPTTCRCLRLLHLVLKVHPKPPGKPRLICTLYPGPHRGSGVSLVPICWSRRSLTAQPEMPTRNASTRSQSSKSYYPLPSLP